MERAVLLIGVSKTGGGMPPLQAVDAGVEVMEAWARGQGIPEANIGKMTDGGGKPVRVRDIADWIKEKNDSLEVADQLIVYFSGHGFHNAADDFWLLSDAPDYPTEAVSLAASEALARKCSFAHVVFISDACRVPSNSIQFGSVTGSSIFPNRPPSGPGKLVDQFFASTEGEPALEVTADGKSCSIYTQQLAQLLSGVDATVLEAQDKSGPTPVVVRAWPLKRTLPGKIARRLMDLKLFRQAVEPDAIITSEPEMWLAAFPQAPGTQPVPPPMHVGAAPGSAFSKVVSDDLVGSGAESWLDRVAGGLTTVMKGLGRPSGDILEAIRHSIEPPVPAPPSAPPPAPAPPAAPPPTPVYTPAAPSEQFQNQLSLALNPALYDAAEARKDIERASDSMFQSVAASHHRVFAPLQMDWHFESECGFVIWNGKVTAARSSGAYATDVISPTEVKVEIGKKAALSLLRFEGGKAALLPALPGDIGYLAVRSDGKLRAVKYQPSSQRPELQAFKSSPRELRLLRTLLSDTAERGDLRLAVVDATQIALVEAVMQSGSEGMDLSLVVLLGYVSYASRRLDLLHDLSKWALDHLGFLPMDVAILLALSDAKFEIGAQAVMPPFPMLAQGWPLMDAAGLGLPELLTGLRSHVLASPWTIVDEVGAAMVEHFLGMEGPAGAEPKAL